MAAHRRSRALSSQTNGAGSTSRLSQSGATSPSQHDPPPAKRPRLKLKVRAREPDDLPDDTIAVGRPRREPKPRSRYSQGSDKQDEVKLQTRSLLKKGSPAPPSALSLSSAPASPREESPPEDPTPPASAREEYGDFMSYYILGGDDEEAAKRAKPKAKTKTRQNLKHKSALESARTWESPSVHGPDPPGDEKPARGQPITSTTQSTPQPRSTRLPHEPPQRPQPHPPQVQHPQRPQAPLGAGPPVHLGPHMHPPIMHHPPPRPMHLPQPIIQFMDVQPDPRPTAPDTIVRMIRKLEELSLALTNFGGVPSAATSPPPPKRKSLVKKPPPAPSNPLDGFLSFFNGDDDDDDESSDDSDTLDYVPTDRGWPDGPLTYGIQFIQNALRSWAQQRMTHQVTQQWNSQQAEQFQRQMAAQKRGPGRPRQYDTEHPVQPIIQMNLADTPEGVAIKAFQSVLDSGCLQVNRTLPTDLSRALRHLYIQIDHLINQGSRADNIWQCMSYHAQIKAHKIRVEKFKEAQTKQAELAQGQRPSPFGPLGQMSLMAPDHAPHEPADRKNNMRHDVGQQQQYDVDQPTKLAPMGSPHAHDRSTFSTSPSRVASKASSQDHAQLPGNSSQLPGSASVGSMEPLGRAPTCSSGASNKGHSVAAGLSTEHEQARVDERPSINGGSAFPDDRFARDGASAGTRSPFDSTSVWSDGAVRRGRTDEEGDTAMLDVPPTSISASNVTKKNSSQDSGISAHQVSQRARQNSNGTIRVSRKKRVSEAISDSPSSGTHTLDGVGGNIARSEAIVVDN